MSRTILFDGMFVFLVFVRDYKKQCAVFFSLAQGTKKIRNKERPAGAGREVRVVQTAIVDIYLLRLYDTEALSPTRKVSKMIRLATDPELLETAARALKAIKEWPAARLDSNFELVRQVAGAASTYGYAVMYAPYVDGLVIPPDAGFIWNTTPVENTMDSLGLVYFFLPPYRGGWQGKAKVLLYGKATTEDAIKLILGLIAYLKG